MSLGRYKLIQYTALTIDSSQSKPVNDVDDSEAAAAKESSEAHGVRNSSSTKQENDKTGDDSTVPFQYNIHLLDKVILATKILPYNIFYMLFQPYHI